MVCPLAQPGPGRPMNGPLLPGDFILVHGKGVAPRLIQFSQRLRFNSDCARWNHAALYIGDGTFIEAKGGHHARRVPRSAYTGEEVREVRVGCGDTAMRANAVAFANAQLGDGYGYLTIVGLVGWCLFGGKLTIGLSGTDICSGLVARSVERMGVIFDRDPATVMPADLAHRWPQPLTVGTA